MLDIENHFASWIKVQCEQLKLVELQLFRLTGRRVNTEHDYMIILLPVICSLHIRVKPASCLYVHTTEDKDNEWCSSSDVWCDPAAVCPSSSCLSFISAAAKPDQDGERTRGRQPVLFSPAHLWLPHAGQNQQLKTSEPEMILSLKCGFTNLLRRESLMFRPPSEYYLHLFVILRYDAINSRWWREEERHQVSVRKLNMKTII